VRVHRWRGAAWTGPVVRAAELPVETVVRHGEGDDHAEGITLLPADPRDPRARLLVVYDVPAPARRPWPDTLLADRLRIGADTATDTAADTAAVPEPAEHRADSVESADDPVEPAGDPGQPVGDPGEPAADPVDPVAFRPASPVDNGATPGPHVGDGPDDHDGPSGPDPAVRDGADPAPPADATPPPPADDGLDRPPTALQHVWAARATDGPTP
jgi:hypothetical protein